MERVEEIIEHPRNDEVIVDTYKTVDDKAGDSYASEVRSDGIPRHDGAFHGGLTEGELQVEERDTKNKEHDHVWD